jgi:hypothetical protein
VWHKWQDQSQGRGEHGGSSGGRSRRDGELPKDVAFGEGDKRMGVRGVAGVWGGDRDWKVASDVSSRKSDLLDSSIMFMV